MKNSIEIKKNSEFGAAGYILAVFLFILYFNVIGLYGLKFALGVIISWGIGGLIWFLRLLFLKAEDKEGVDKPFAWCLFLLFPLFMPLAMPLWIIPIVLVISYFVVVSAFGGYGRHIFNPIVVAIVVLLYGYGDAGILNASRPFERADIGYKIWTAGIPPRFDIRDVNSGVESANLIQASLKGMLPNIPGSCYGIIILAASFLFSMIFKRRIHWWLVSVGSICSFAYVLPQPSSFCIPPLNVLILGIVPSLLLAGIADFITIPESAAGQIINAILFGFFAVLMIFNSSDILAPAYGFLLAQVISPLIIDLIGVRNE